MMIPTGIKQSEASIQQSIVKWYRNTYCLKHHNPRCMIFSIPNESNGQRASRLISTGLYPGCADFVVLHNKSITMLDGDEFEVVGFNVTPIFFEVKTPSGIQSPKQKAFQEHCKQMGLRYYLVRSLEEFKQVIENL